MLGAEAVETLEAEPDRQGAAVLRPAPRADLTRLFGPVAETAPAAAAPRAAGWRDALRPVAKRTLDILGSGALLLALAMPFLVIALLVRRDGGPVFFAHARVGRHGRMFGCLKFRTMVPDAERRLGALLERDPAARAEWEATRKLRHDPRVTWIGKFLRASSLDELPQLLNVLRGEMSLVGPRPVQAAELATFYGTAAAHYQAVRPGITGLWQVSGRSDTSYARRVALDVTYVTRPSLREDLRILLRTPGVVLLRRGAY